MLVFVENLFNIIFWLSIILGVCFEYICMFLGGYYKEWVFLGGEVIFECWLEDVWVNECLLVFLGLGIGY